MLKNVAKQLCFLHIYCKRKVGESVEAAQFKNQKIKKYMAKEDIENIKRKTAMWLEKEKNITFSNKNRENIDSIESKLEKIQHKQTLLKQAAAKLNVNYREYCNLTKSKEAVENVKNKVNTAIEKANSIDINSADKAEFSKKEKQIKDANTMAEDINSWLEKAILPEVNKASKGEINEFKKSIYQKVKELKAKGDLKTLTNEKNKIINKPAYIKYIDKITGRAKKDKMKLEELEEKTSAINAKLSAITYLEKEKYSMHRIVGEISVYVKENEENKVAKEEVTKLTKLTHGIKNIFQIEEERVEKEKNKLIKEKMPAVINKKLTKEERKQREINSWINKNEYRYIPRKETVSLNEAKDLSIANSCKRLINYIDEKESNIAVAEKSKNNREYII
ncbi:MAG: hypothetical protein RR922_05920 [Clostridia bacterium]